MGFGFVLLAAAICTFGVFLAGRGSCTAKMLGLSCVLGGLMLMCFAQEAADLFLAATKVS